MAYLYVTRHHPRTSLCYRNTIVVPIFTLVTKENKNKNKSFASLGLKLFLDFRVERLWKLQCIFFFNWKKEFNFSHKEGKKKKSNFHGKNVTTQCSTQIRSPFFFSFFSHFTRKLFTSKSVFVYFYTFVLILSQLGYRMGPMCLCIV